MRTLAATYVRNGQTTHMFPNARWIVLALEHARD